MGIHQVVDGPHQLAQGPHEVAILVTGAAAGARYELYAHERVAAATDLTKAKTATIVAGQRPNDLTSEEAAAYDMAAALTRGGALPEATYRAAVDAFDQDGAAELIYLIGGYSLVSVLLNALISMCPVPTRQGADCTVVRGRRDHEQLDKGPQPDIWREVHDV